MNVPIVAGFVLVEATMVYLIYRRIRPRSPATDPVWRSIERNIAIATAALVVAAMNVVLIFVNRLAGWLL